jgi:hypothetical protein
MAAIGALYGDLPGGALGDRGPKQNAADFH